MPDIFDKKTLSESDIRTKCVTIPDSMPDRVASIARDAFEGCGNVLLVCAGDNYATDWAQIHGVAYFIR